MEMGVALMSIYYMLGVHEWTGTRRIVGEI